MRCDVWRPRHLHSASFSKPEVRWITTSAHLPRDQAHVVKSTLKLVSKYDETTKLGLKVFHLQRLSETTVRDHQLLHDERYVLLKKALFTIDSFKQLSIAQRIAASVSLGRLDGKDKKEWTIIANGLKAACLDIQGGISASQLSVSLYWIARSGNSVCIRDRALERVGSKLLQSSNSWTPLDMGWLMFFLRTKQSVSGDLEDRLIRQLAFRFNERLNQMTLRNVSCILHEFSKLELLPARAIHRALRRILDITQKVDAKSTCLLLMSLVRLKVFRDDALGALGSRLIESGIIQNKKRSSIREVSTILYAFSKLGTLHKPLIESCLKRLMTEPVDQITDADLGMMAFALGQFGIMSCGSEWARIVSISKERIRSMSPLNLSTIVCAIARAGVEDADFFRLVSEAVSKDQRSYTSRQLVNLVNAYATAGINTDWIQIPSNLPCDRVTRFQVNKKLDGAPIMNPLAIQSHHKNIESFLRLNGWKDVELCKQTGSVWADAVFSDGDASKYAVVVSGIGDVCKLDRASLLGPIKWKLRYLESRGYIPITVAKKNLKSLSRVWNSHEMRNFIRAEQPLARPTRHKSPIAVDPESGKVSFHRL